MKKILLIGDSIRKGYDKYVSTSTPIREELFTGPCKRYNRDTELYNVVGI